MNRVASSAVVGVALAGVVLAATPAEAATLKSRALSVAKAQKGDPYQWGAAGPHRFDCSGLVYYSYKKVGKKLPRTAQAQYNSSRKVSPSKRQVGDLIFIGKSSKGIYHVGIYAGVKNGYGMMWDAPKPGRKVGLHKIKDYTAGSPKAYYGRY
ncbi:peptidase [Streptomyces phage Galactica]|nr:peptidase [Streptomyces phage Galactica]